MSYIDAPRLHFSGIFIADPSTVNNTPGNYDPEVVNPNLGWNPNGTGKWQLKDCTVQSVVYIDGTTCNTSADDPIIGSPVQSTDQPQVAKVVDLDPEQQMATEIWGFQVQVGTASGPDSFVGDFKVAAFSDIWFRAVGSGVGGDAPMGAFFQSVLRHIKWDEISGSRFLKELFEESPNELSIKFNLDGINMDSTSSKFTQGRIVGTIGPARDNEPKHFIAGRLLRSAPGTSTDPNLQPMTLQGTPESSPMFFAPCKIDYSSKRVLLDLGNSISTTTPGGPANPALGDLWLAILPPYAAPVTLGQINYSDTDWYTTTAGIQEFPLTDDQFELSENNPLGVVQMNSDGTLSQPLIQENSSGMYVRADRFVFRLNPGQSAEAHFLATRFGQPAANETISLALDSMSVDRMQSPPNPDNIPTGVPGTALEFPPSITTGEDGRVTVTITASDPGNPRKFIDGQVYGISYLLNAAAEANYNPDPSNFISLLVFNSHPPVASPTWSDVKPVLSQYAKLYPFMTIGVGINLADYTAVRKNLAAIKRVLTLRRTDPGYMQVTRDMSRDKLELILAWIDQGAPLGADDPELILTWINPTAPTGQ